MPHQPGRSGQLPQETLAPLPLDRDRWAAAVEALELSPQQARIVEMLLRGMRDKQIAAELGLGVPTVRTYFDRIFRRVGVPDRVALVVRVFTVAYAGRDGCPRSR